LLLFSVLIDLACFLSAKIVAKPEFSAINGDKQMNRADE
jgi:hypothetical protein